MFAQTAQTTYKKRQGRSQTLHPHDGPPGHWSSFWERSRVVCGEAVGTLLGSSAGRFMMYVVWDQQRKRKRKSQKEGQREAERKGERDRDREREKEWSL